MAESGPTGANDAASSQQDAEVEFNLKRERDQFSNREYNSFLVRASWTDVRALLKRHCSNPHPCLQRAPHELELLRCRSVAAFLSAQPSTCP